MESWNTGWYGVDPRTGETVWAERGYGVIVGRDADTFLLAGKERQHLVDPVADIARWDTRPSTPVAAISDQVAVISDETARPTVRGLDPTTGEEMWSFESPVGLLTRIDVVATDDHVFIMGGEGAVVALDALTGEEDWTNTELMRAYNDDEYMSQTLAIAAADERHVYLYVFSDGVIAIDVDSGQIEWRHAVPDGGGPYVWPGGDTVAISGDRGAIVLDAATGQQLAVRNGDAVAPPASDGHLVCGIFGTSGDQKLTCLEPSA
jgi:outer membrane protein assembly factor BamB